MQVSRRIFLLVAIMTVVAMSASAIAILVLYEAAFREERDRLREIAQSRARVLEAVARFDAVHIPDFPGGAAAGTLEQITDAHERFQGFGRTGEFTLARREGDRIVFLLSHRHGGLETPGEVPFSSEVAEPMRRALSGESGTVVGLDYRGETVLAAYEPVGELDLGIVAKIDRSEIQSPFLQAGLLAGGGSLLLILFGTFLFFQVSQPMVRAVEESERRYRGIFDAGADILLLADRDGTVLDANPAACAAWGCARNAFPPENLRAIVRTGAGDIFNGEKPTPPWETPLQGDFLRSDGSCLPVEVRFSPAWYEGRMATLAAVRDITERQEADRKIRRSEERLALAVEAGRAGVFEHDVPVEQDVHVSDRWAEIIGYRREELPSKETLFEWWAEQIHPEDYPRVLKTYEDFIRGRTETYTVEFRQRHKSGRWVHIGAFSKAVERDSGNRATRVAGLNFDITERVLAEAALRESEKKWRDLFESATFGIILFEFITDEAGRAVDFIHLTVNPATEQHTGLAREEIQGKHASEIATPGELKTLLDVYGRVVETGEPSRYQMYVEAYGRTLDVMAFALGGKRFAATFTDVSDRIRAEQDKARLEGQLRQAQKMEAIGTLSGGIAHDFNNILGIIVGNTELAMNDLPEWNPAHGNLQEVQKASLRARDMVRQILAFSRQSGREMKPVRMGPGHRGITQDAPRHHPHHRGDTAGTVCVRGHGPGRHHPDQPGPVEPVHQRCPGHAGNGRSAGGDAGGPGLKP
jgi:PAS domain S-box-containing protein